MRVPENWQRYESLPGWDSLERSCVANVAVSVTLSLEGGRLVSWHADVRAPRRDDLPYEIDLLDALVDLSGSGGPPWQDPATIVPPPPPPPPFPPSRGTGKPLDTVDTSLAARTAQHREWHIIYARDYARRRVMPVSDGWFVAFAAGEYGGSLWWYPRTPGRGRLLWRGNVRWLEAIGDEVVAIGGLAHLQSAEGFVLWLSRGADGWSVRHQADLQDAPSAVVRDAGGAVVVGTSKSLERVTADGLEIIVRATFPLGPETLIAAPNGEFAAGMRVFAYVFRPTATGYRAEIYVPPGCDYRYEGLVCVCRPAG